MSHNLPKPSEAELDILQQIWASPRLTVREVHEALLKKKKVGYTTTLKQMQRMVEKKLLIKEDQNGGQVYLAAIAQEALQGAFFDKMVNTLFKGSAMNLVMHALGKSDTDQKDLEALKSWIEKQEGDKNE